MLFRSICRAVCLDVKEPAYLRDIFIETKAEGGFRIYTATVGETVGCTLQAEIRSPSGSRAFYTGELSLPITGALNSVHPWSIEHPTLYTLTVRLIRPGTGGLPDRVLDEKSCHWPDFPLRMHSSHNHYTWFLRGSVTHNLYNVE